MARIDFYYDTETSQFCQVHKSVWNKILRTVSLTFLTLATAALMVVVYDANHDFPSEIILRQQITEMELNYNELDNRLVSIYNEISTIEERDDHVYRMVLGTEPVDQAVRNGGVGGSGRYMEIRDRKMPNSERMARLYSSVDKLRRKLYIESISQDELLQMATEKQKLYSSIPSIQPISNKQLKALTSGFGLRFHPFYNRIAMHAGIDFAAEEGTPVYATADGEIVAADTTVAGYGKMITIDHGHGYQTRYAHLNDFVAQPGKLVMRGELIAYVGNTGMSTGPHLHYEIMLQGNPINPIDYFFKDLNPTEYEQITKLASASYQSMGN